MNRSPDEARPAVFTRREIIIGGSVLSGSLLASRRIAFSQPATATPGAGNAMQALVDRIRAPEPGDETVTAMIDALALCGLPTYADTLSAEPIVPVQGPPAPNRLTWWQAHNLAMEVRTSGGRTGADYDLAIPVPEGAPSASWLLAGYVATAETPGGELARAVMGDRDWSQPAPVPFPAVIGALLLADVARDIPTTMARAFGTSLTGDAAFTLRQGGVCSTLQGWVDATIKAIFDALKLDEPESGPGQVIVGIWNWLVDVGETVVGGALSELTDSVLSIIRTIVGLLGTASQIVSMLRPWTISVEPAPEVTAFAIDDAVVTGSALVTVSPGLVTEWPADIADCAAVAGTPLPSLVPGNEPVTWQYTEMPIDLVVITGEPAQLDATGKATLAYETNHESAEVAKGEAHEGFFVISPTVERDDLQSLIDMVLNTAFASLPGIVRDIVVPILGPMASEIVGSLVEMASVTGYGMVTVIYHTPPENTVTPEVPETTDCLSGTWRIVDFISMLNSYVVSIGSATTYTGQSGDAFMTFGPGDTVTWSATAWSITGGETAAGVGTVEVTMTLDGTLTGRYAVDGDLVTIVEATGGGMSGTAVASLNGSPVGETPVDVNQLGFQGGAGYTYSCDGNQLLMYPTWIPASAPMVLQRS